LRDALFILSILAPIIVYLIGVWVGTELDYRSFLRDIQSFDEVTKKNVTPRVKLTAYQKIINTSKRTLRLKDWDKALRLRKRVFIEPKTLRTPSDEKITLALTRKKDDV
jgi:hypothetical protein